MKHRELILASKSPRRKELLEDCGFTFSIHSETTEEILYYELGKEKAIERIAYDKAKAVAKQHSQAIVIGADTMVCYHHEILGKPKDTQECERMLKMLSNQTHEVITGVAILCEEQSVIFHEITQVSFYPLSDKMIHNYIATKEPFDKAGAYGIQGKGKLFVKEIHGDYFNVVGLPIARVYREIKNLQKILI